MPTVVLAPDGFKGTLSAADAASAIAEGWASVDPGARFVHRPMADGGEGTVDAVEAAVTGAMRMPITVDGPGGRAVDTAWLRLPPTPVAPQGTAVVELASASGIELLEEPRPWDADTRGLGQAIAAALDHGVSRILVGIGSSSSTDGGTGALTALGARFLDANGAPVTRGARGLADIVSVDLGRLRPAPRVAVLSDVANPLTGRRGAAAVFGPQKGLVDAAEIVAVDRSLAALAALFGIDPRQPGTGAAGGAGAGLLAWGAVLTPGAAQIAELIDLADAIADADVVVTGEGSYDRQSAAGKVPWYVARLASMAGTPVHLAAGRIAEDADTSPFAESRSLTALAGSQEAAVADPERWLRAAGADLARRR